MSNLEIVAMSENDIEAACEIEKRCFSVPFKKEDLKCYFESPIWHFLVAKLDGVVIGYLSYMAIGDEADLVNIAVLPEFRGKKAGKSLLCKLIENARYCNIKCIHLEVRESNEIAISLYKKYGFVVVGVSKNHYSSPTEDALRMNLNL